MATKAQKAEERMRAIQNARKSIASMDDFEIGSDPKVISSPDGCWIQAWIKVPLPTGEFIIE